ncbi:beta strand repeat-containing protein [Verrucomicrobium spinosum]|uniref:beta strand repeat-containing protein n=1 Tax=Verrucomicrobium spinosum TaxID=2736 RepID=UPI0009464C8A|nr:hypothetical protein [Verrucomicrobium spinosum]
MAVAGAGIGSDAVIHNTVQSYATGSQVTALQGSVNFDARSTVSVTPVFVSTAVSAGLGAAVSVIRSSVDIGGATRAYVHGGALSARNLTVSADHRTDANASLVSVSGGLLSASAIAATINDSSSVVAHITGTTVTTTDPAVGVTVRARGQTYITTLNVAAGFGVVAGTVVSSTASASPDVEAYLGDETTIAAGAGDVNVTASHSGTVQSTGVGASAGVIAVGVTVIESSLTPKVVANTRGDVIISGSDVLFDAKSDTVGRNISLDFLAGSGLGAAAAFINGLIFGGEGVQSLAFAGAGGIGAGVGVVATTIYSPDVFAGLSDDTEIEVTGDVTVRALAEGLADSTGLGITVGALAVGFVQTNANVNGNVKTDVGGRIKARNLTLDTDGNLDAEALTVAAAGGVIGVAINSSDIFLNPEVVASLRDYALIELEGNLSIQAHSDAAVKANTVGVDAGIVSVGSSAVDVSMTPTVSSTIGDNVLVNAEGTILVQAAVAQNQSTTKVTASSGKLIGMTGLEIEQTFVEDVSAGIGANSQILGMTGISILAAGRTTSRADAQVFVVGGLSGQNAEASEDIRSTVATGVGTASTVFSKGIVTIDADNQIDVDNLTGTQFYGVGSLNFARSETDVTGLDGSTLARTTIGQGAIVEGVTVNVSADVSKLKITHNDTSGEQYSVGGFIQTTSDIDVRSDVEVLQARNSTLIGGTVNVTASRATSTSTVRLAAPALASP